MSKKKDNQELDPNVPRTREQDRAALRRKVENFYDLQRLRMQTAGRTYKRADGTEIQLLEVDLHILERRAKELESVERAALRDIESHLETMSFYRDVLSDKVRYKGIGPTMAGVILSSFDIERETTPSKMWAFAGLRPLPAVRCLECHSVLAESTWAVDTARAGEPAYTHTKERVRTLAPPKPGEEPPATLPKCSQAKSVLGRDGVYDSGKAQRPIKGEKLAYNAWLRTKLVGVLAPVLLKVGSPWKKTYDDYKHRKTSAGWGRSDAHRHQAAMRYMIKMLLLDIWTKWREHESLPLRGSYHEEKLGHKHEGEPVELVSEEMATELKKPRSEREPDSK